MNRNTLERSHLVYVDVQDQATGSKFLIIEESPVVRSVFQVDSIEVKEHSIIAYLHGKIGDTIVLEFSPLFPWKLVDKSFAYPASSSEIMELDAVDHKIRNEYADSLRKKHFPEGGAPDNETGLALPVPTGQYL